MDSDGKLHVVGSLADEELIGEAGALVEPLELGRRGGDAEGVKEEEEEEEEEGSRRGRRGAARWEWERSG